ncbi:hypothetical protein LTR95_000915 [Oleoguttula sp. CCFEE 5521]
MVAEMTHEQYDAAMRFIDGFRRPTTTNDRDWWFCSPDTWKNKKDAYLKVLGTSSEKSALHAIRKIEQGGKIMETDEGMDAPNPCPWCTRPGCGPCRVFKGKDEACGYCKRQGKKGCMASVEPEEDEEMPDAVEDGEETGDSAVLKANVDEYVEIAETAINEKLKGVKTAFVKEQEKMKAGIAEAGRTAGTQIIGMAEKTAASAANKIKEAEEEALVSISNARSEAEVSLKASKAVLGKKPQAREALHEASEDVEVEEAGLATEGKLEEAKQELAIAMRTVEKLKDDKASLAVQLELAKGEIDELKERVAAQ